jgi:hypothetical protein
MASGCASPVRGEVYPHPLPHVSRSEAVAVDLRTKGDSDRRKPDVPEGAHPNEVRVIEIVNDAVGSPYFNPSS